MSNTLSRRQILKGGSHIVIGAALAASISIISDLIADSAGVNLAQAQTQKTYYVKPNGSSTASGLDESNAVTFARAHSLSVSGDTIMMMGGTYYRFSFKLTKPNLTVRAAPGHTPILDGRDASGNSPVSYGFNVYKSSGSDSTFIGLTLSYYKDRAFYIQANNVTIDGCTVTRTGVSTDSASAAVGIMVSSPQDAPINRMTIKNCKLLYNGVAGAAIYYVQNLQFYDNIVQYNNQFKRDVNNAAAGIKLYRSTNATVRDNDVSYNLCNGIWLDELADSSRVYRNVCKYNSNIGIFAELSGKISVFLNTVIGNKYGVFLAQSADSRVINNTFDDNYIATVLKDHTRAATGSSITPRTKNNVFKNNLISRKKADDRALDARTVPRGSGVTTESMMASWNYNGYHQAINNYNIIILTGNRYYKQADALSTATSYDENRVFSSAADDPFYANRSTGDYRLRSGSLAIGAGSRVDSDIASLSNGVLSASSSNDLGAHQYL